MSEDDNYQAALGRVHQALQLGAAQLSDEQLEQLRRDQHIVAVYAKTRMSSTVLQSDEGQARFKIKPMPGKILVEVLGKTDRVGELGIIFAPDTSKVPRTTARVLAVYEPFTLKDGDAETEPFVAVGDIIVFGQWSGTSMTIKRKDYLILREHDILCIIEGADEDDIQQTAASLSSDD